MRTATWRCLLGGVRGHGTWAGRVLMWVWLVVALSPAMILGQTRSDDASQEAFVLAGGIMSPYCPGRTLAACPSSAAADLRVEVAGRLAQGESREAIVESLVTRFGQEIRGAPRPVGFGLALWTAPAVIAVLLLGALIAAGRGARSGSTGVEGSDPAGDVRRDALHAQLDGELDQME